uniref:Lipase domain-containing protein n=1 Tax=Rhabditophanes sp. KR3021 TaxID=114890 RepID=A0AC35TQ07_9BILA
MLLLNTIVLAVTFFVLASAEFSPDFQDFVRTKYGRNFLKSIERIDMGSYELGSFGGKASPDEVIRRRPVLFVHGTMLRAGIFKQHRQLFMDRGYQKGELYATTFGDGGRTALLNKPMYCEDVKIVRRTIEAIINYANSTIDVIGYSMGCAITRKAILGGRCVDTGEQIGIPLTNYVHTYIAVAGVAYGFEGCSTMYGSNFACNLVNGMHCQSEYLKELNSQPARFEGRHTFSIYSKEDGLVGQNCCGHACSTLRFAEQNFARNSNSHFSIVHQTKELMYDLIIGNIHQLQETL